MNFPKLYDLFQQDVDYDALLAPILSYLNKNQQILDAGCGSGHILSYLLDAGFDVLGIDNDEDMLELAQKNMSSDSFTSRLFFHDLRKPLNHKFHQIVSLLDVFHYFKGIKGVVKNLYHALYDGGRLFIDLYKKPQNTTESGKLLDMQYLWEVQTKNSRIIHKIRLVTNNKVYTYKIKQYYYPLDYYIDILKSTGFKVEMFSGFDDRKIYLMCTK